MMEKEGGEINKNEPRDETGFSEKQLDTNVEKGIFKRGKAKKVIKKVIFEKKPKRC